MINLNKSQRDYIESNIDKKSLRQIAKELKIDKKTIHRYIKKTEKIDSAPYKNKTPSFIEKITIKISEKQKMIIQIVVVFVIALLVRLIYIYQLNHTYFFAPFKGGLDDYMFDNWAREILKGNWIDDRVLYIYRMPLYGYFLAFIYFIFGTSCLAAYMVNAFIGSISCVLVYFIGKTVFDKNVGFIAGLFNALAGILLFYTGMLVGETLGIFIICLAFIALLFFEKTEKKRHLFISGMLIGVSLLIKGSAFAIIPLVMIWTFNLYRKTALIKPAVCSALLLLGLLLPLSFIGIRNYIYEKDFVPVTAQGGLTFYIGNAYGADGRLRLVDEIGSNQKDMLINSINLAEKSAGRSLKPSEVSNFWFNQTLKSITDNGSLFIFPLLVKKLIVFWNSYEIPDIWDYYFFKNFIPILKLPLFTFSLVIPLGLTGIYLGWVKKKNAGLLFLFVTGSMLSLMISFVGARYRIQVFPFLSVFAAYGILEVFRVLRSDKIKFTIALVIIVAAAIFSNINIEKVTSETLYNNLGIILKREGKTEEAEKMYNRAIEIAPRYPSPYYNLGLLYRDNSRADLAKLYFTKTLEIAPDFIEAKQKLEELSAY